MLCAFFERSERVFERDVKDTSWLFWFKEGSTHWFNACGDCVADVNEPKGFTDAWWSEDNRDAFIGDNAFNDPRLRVFGIGFEQFLKG